MTLRFWEDTNFRTVDKSSFCGQIFVGTVILYSISLLVHVKDIYDLKKQHRWEISSVKIQKVSFSPTFCLIILFSYSHLKEMYRERIATEERVVGRGNVGKCTIRVSTLLYIFSKKSSKVCNVLDLSFSILVEVYIFCFASVSGWYYKIWILYHIL